MRSNLIDLEVCVERDEPKLEKAVLVNLGGKKHWLPRSQIEIEYKDQNGLFAIVTMPEWLAIEKGMV